LAELQLDITAENRTGNITPSELVVYVLHTCQPSPESHTPSFLLRADNYDGSIYDQDPSPGIGRIYAAEYVIADGNVISNEYVICQSDDEVYTKNVVRFGPEHILTKLDEEN
jgi:hypothetical protein